MSAPPRRGPSAAGLAAAGLVLAVVCFLCVNLISALTIQSARLDLTSDGRYTLSDGTRAVLADLEEPITLRFFLSASIDDAFPAYASFADRVREMLDGYARLGRGRITVEEIDPRPFSPAEDRAVALGLRGVAINAAGDTGYLGLVGTNSTDDRDAIPFLNLERERFLEHDLTRLVYNLAHPEKPVVALIDGLGLRGDPGNALAGRPGGETSELIKQIRQFYAIEPVANDALAIEGDLAMIVHPHTLGPRTLYAIDQFVLSGGRALVFIDPFYEHAAYDAARGRQTIPTGSSLSPVLEAWGVEFEDGMIVGDRRRAMRIQVPRGGRVVVTDHLPWLDLGPESLDPDDAVTGKVARLELHSAGALRAAPGATTTLTPLVSTSDEAALLGADDLRVMLDPEALHKDFTPGGTPLVVAARVTGPARSAFDGPPDGAAPEPATAHVAESDGPISIIVVADADMLIDEAWLDRQDVLGEAVAVPRAGNAAFVINALDSLSGESVLAGLRGRGILRRPLTVIEDMRADAEARFLAREQALIQKLRATESRLRDLDPGPVASGGLLLTPERQEALDSFRAEASATRAELREVRHGLRSDIESLESTVRLVNIIAIPALIALAALALALWRWARARQALREASS